MSDSVLRAHTVSQRPAAMAGVGPGGAVTRTQDPPAQSVSVTPCRLYTSPSQLRAQSVRLLTASCLTLSPVTETQFVPHGSSG